MVNRVFREVYSSTPKQIKISTPVCFSHYFPLSDDVVVCFSALETVAEEAEEDVTNSDPLSFSAALAVSPPRRPKTSTGARRPPPANGKRKGRSSSIHIRDARYQCNVCDKFFTSPAELQQHLRDRHGLVPKPKKIPKPKGK